MKFDHLASATLLALLADPSPGQESRPDQDIHDRVVTLARGLETERLAALLFLEDSRSTDVVAWKTVFGWKENREVRADPKSMGRLLRAIGRVGEPELQPLLKAGCDEFPGPWVPEYRNGIGVAVGLLGDAALIGELGARGSPMNYFAMGLRKMLPDALPPIVSESRSTDSRSGRGPESDTFADHVEAALRWGAGLDPPVFHDLAHGMLVGRAASPVRIHAAVDYFARSKVKAPADLLPILTEQLVAEDPELAGLSARALAKSEGAGDLAAAAIEAAFLSGGSRVAQVDRIRALGAIKSTVAVLALVRAIGPSRADSAVRRTVLEALKGSAFHMADAHSRVLAARQVRAIIRSSDGESPAPADVRAAAVSFLAAFDPDQFRTLLPELRLAAPWKVRAAAAAGLFGQSAVDEGWVKSFLADPDRRVRIAALEAFALKPTPNPNVLESLFERFSATPHHHHIPRTFDPVELSALASAIKAGDPQKAPLFLNGLFGTRAAAGRKIPHHEVEALQSILDLVASTEWDQREATLRQYLHSPEISLRKRAKELLAKKGIDASEHRPHDDQAAARLLDACIARAKRLEDEPVASAVIETSKGDLTIALFRSDAPATVENFLELAKRGFYDGTLWHRVVPAFVAQAGCPRGDGWGGPGYTIRCEVNHRTYRRGSIGMALAGKDTGGSQFFICHRSLPQLDGRYTLFGQVVDGMDVVDSLTEEDWIVRVREP